ncbi:hypothetical protein H1C71_012287, partial [Ictidomys tridecemlineatus]
LSKLPSRSPRASGPPTTLARPPRECPAGRPPAVPRSCARLLPARLAPPVAGSSSAQHLLPVVDRRALPKRSTLASDISTFLVPRTGPHWKLAAPPVPEGGSGRPHGRLEELRWNPAAAPSWEPT